jgi:hypothetical protein
MTGAGSSYIADGGVHVCGVLQGQAELVQQWGPSLLHVDDLPFQQGLQDMPDVFTRFREQVEQVEQFKVRSRAFMLLIRERVQRRASKLAVHADLQTQRWTNTACELFRK